jgi:hypothetical protein
MLFNPEPSLSGAYRLRDTGGEKPHCTRPAAGFSYGTRMYTLHTQTCSKGKRTRARSS